MRKHVLKSFSLALLAAISLVAFAASSAQAVDQIKILGSAALAKGLTLAISQEGKGLLVVPALSIEIVCNKASGSATIAESGDGTGAVVPSGSATILYEECNDVFAINAKQELGELLPCHVINEAKPTPLLHVEAKGTAKVVLNAAKEGYLLAEGAPFATIKFLSGTSCPLPLKTEIKGQAVFKITLGVGSEEKEALVESNEAIQKALGTGDKLLYGTNEAFVKGSAKLETSGAEHLGCTWGFL